MSNRLRFLMPQSEIKAPLHPNEAILALGGNQGDRLEQMQRVLILLERAGAMPVALSRLYWTRPLGGMDQPEYLNAAARVRTSLRPLELLWRCRAVELAMGRRRGERWAPRVMDVDLVFYGSARMNRPELTLPHPRWAERDFVLAGLLDLNIMPPGWNASHARRRLMRQMRQCESCILKIQR